MCCLGDLHVPQYIPYLQGQRVGSPFEDRAKKIYFCAVKFEPTEENRITYECLHCWFLCDFATVMGLILTKIVNSQ